MPDYELYYWDLPFRGNFIQLLLEEVRADYRKLAASEVYPDTNLSLHYPGMAPPYLYDCRAQLWFAQMPAILMHLAKAYHFLPDDAEQQTLALFAKVRDPVPAVHALDPDHQVTAKGFHQSQRRLRPGLAGNRWAGEKAQSVSMPATATVFTLRLRLIRQKYALVPDQ